jgi:hypothetical protein
MVLKTYHENAGTVNNCQWTVGWIVMGVHDDSPLLT